MAYSIDQIMPWGRCLDEYITMFALSESDLRSNILGCGDGPASFNMEMYAAGKSIVSVDPVYRNTLQQIKKKIKSTYPIIMKQLNACPDAYCWKHFTSLQHLGKIRMAAMELFLSDFETGKKQRRYRPYELSVLPFDDHYFDLALCSHLLFLYYDHLSIRFHFKAIKEMLRVAKEVRIFPLLTLEGKKCPHLNSVCLWIEKKHYHYKIETVDYEFQRGGNKLLRIW